MDVNPDEETHSPFLYGSKLEEIEKMPESVVVTLAASLRFEVEGMVGVLCSFETLTELPLLLLLVSPLLPFEVLLASAIEPLCERE